MINEEPNAPEEAPAADKDTAPSEKPEQGLDASEWILVVLSFIAVTLTFPLSIWLCIEVVYEYEQAVILRLGHMKKGGAKGPGVYFLLPCTDIILRVDMRTRSVNLPLQEIFTKDPLNVDVDGVIYFRVKNPVLAVTGAIDVDTAIQLLAQTTLKMVVGTKNLSEVISNREKIAQSVQSTLDNVISHWGVKVERVEINDVKARVKVYLALALSPEGGREPVDHYCTSMSLFKGNRDPYLLRGDKDLWGTILYSGQDGKPSSRTRAPQERSPLLQFPTTGIQKRIASDSGRRFTAVVATGQAPASGRTSPKMVKEATVIMTESPLSFRLHCLQTGTTTVATEPNSTDQQSSTIIFRLP